MERDIKMYKNYKLERKMKFRKNIVKTIDKLEDAALYIHDLNLDKKKIAKGIVGGTLVLYGLSWLHIFKEDKIDNQVLVYAPNGTYCYTELTGYTDENVPIYEPKAKTVYKLSTVYKDQIDQLPKEAEIIQRSDVNNVYQYLYDKITAEHSNAIDLNEDLEVVKKELKKWNGNEEIEEKHYQNIYKK